MKTTAERDAFGKRVRLLAPVGVVILIVYGAAIWSLNRTASTEAVIGQALVGVLPNFLAAIVIALIVYWFIRLDDYASYVKAMRSIRITIGDKRQAGRLETAEVQRMMVQIVPAVSLLYFREDHPPVPVGRQTTQPRRNCFACSQPFPVVDGRCKECGDILDSWQAVEQG